MKKVTDAGFAVEGTPYGEFMESYFGTKT